MSSGYRAEQFLPVLGSMRFYETWLHFLSEDYCTSRHIDLNVCSLPATHDLSIPLDGRAVVLPSLGWCASPGEIHSFRPRAILYLVASTPWGSSSVEMVVYPHTPLTSITDTGTVQRVDC